MNALNTAEHFADAEEIAPVRSKRERLFARLFDFALAFLLVYFGL